MKKTGLIRNRVLAALSACVLAFGAMTAVPTLHVAAQVTPNPLISRNVPAYTSIYGTSTAANDDTYASAQYNTLPCYIAYDLSGVPTEDRGQVLAVWYNGTYNYDMTVLGTDAYNMPKDYTIEVNAAEGGAYPEENWETVITVTDNTLHSRQHVLDLTGYNWIQINVTEAQSTGASMIGINFDVHNCADGVCDSWIFYGDSITAGGMTVDSTGYGTFSELINGMDFRYFPAAENGGIGGIFSTDGAANIDRWLALFPGEYVCIAYGTNDAWGNQTGTAKYYENLAFMVEAVQTAGKTAVVSKIPWAANNDVQSNVPSYNAMVDAIYAAYPDVVPGPDFEAFFGENPELISTDGVHPSTEGYAEMRKLWAETMYAAVYTQTEPSVDGDVDCDGDFDAADVKLLQGYLVCRCELGNADTADRNQDGLLDAFDLALLKQKLLA